MNCAIDSDKRSQGTLFSGLESRLPLALIDSRIIDLAIHFEQQPDSNLLNGYRRLEDLVREQSGFAAEFGAKLFQKAFVGDESPLMWEGIDGSEQQQGGKSQGKK
jgi:hypothetical protein